MNKPFSHLNFKRFGLFILAIFLFQQGNSHEACGTNCIKCDKDFHCNVCDFYMNKVVSEEKTCTDNPFKNCKSNLSIHFCNVCIDHYYFNLISHKCEEIIPSERIENCLVYFNKNECSSCSEGNVLNSGKCVPVNSAVSGCLEYAQIASENGKVYYFNKLFKM